jgi:hypothetical protein
LRYLHCGVFSRFRWPEFGRDRHFVCQIHLDYRLFPTGEYASQKEACSDALRLLCDQENSRYQAFLDLSNPAPRAPRVRLPVVLPAAVLHHHAKGVAPATLSIGSFVLEIGATTIGVKAMLCQPLKATRAIEDCAHILGRDVGYTNTVTLAVIKANAPIEAGRMAWLSALNMEGMKEFLQTHHHRAMDVAEVVRFSGRRFLGLLEKDGERIARLSSEISQVTEKMMRLKTILNGAQGCSQAQVERDQRPPESLQGEVHDKFFRVLAARDALVARRDDLWTRGSAI